MHSTRADPPFVDRLRLRWRQSSSLLCVGLDPDPARFPRCLAGRDDAIFEFCKSIIESTHDLVCAFKPQIAYFASQRAEAQLEALIQHIKTTYPDIVVVLDAKRGDIGSTAEHYAREAFERYRADAVTLSPYLGFDAIAPFLAYADKGAIILCRTSNAGGGDLQCANVSGRPLFEHVARLVSGSWNAQGQCALVVGATYPAELALVRQIAGEMPLLVPGIGAQGGDIEATVKAGQTAEGGMMINSSRAVLYAGKGEDFGDAARRVALETRDAINRFRDF